MRAFAAVCLLLAVALGGADLRRSAGSRPAAPRPALLHRVAGRYDRSRPGRRLAERLWRAQVRLSPSAWRGAQVMLAAPVATTAVALGAAPLPALAAAMTVTRSGGALLLRLRRRAALRAADAAAPQLARALATELAAWGSGGQALTSAARRAEADGPLVLRRVLQGAAAWVLLGGDATSALQRSLDEAVAGLAPCSPAARVAAVFALHRYDAAAVAAALERLAAALEADAAARRDVEAVTGEVRMSAVAVPALAGGTLAVLLAGDPPALAAALSLPVLPILGAAVLIVVCASLAARRVVAV
jgi:hypothetical protein